MKFPLTVALAIFVGQASAQTLADLRNEIRDELAHVRFAQFIVGLVDITEETELVGANYEIDDDMDLEVSTLNLPFHTGLPLSQNTVLFLEGNLGYLTAEGRNPDIFPDIAGLEGTSVKTKWTAYSALAGAGVELPILDRVTFAPIFQFSLARVENDTSYGGPGAAAAAALLDGILFNWEGTFFSYGAGLRADWDQPLGEEHGMELILRYDLFQTETLHSTDRAQDVSEDSQRFTTRLDFTGPTGWELFDSPLEWRTILGYRLFPGDTGDAVGFDDFVEVGAGLELNVPDGVPVVSQFSLSGTLIYGQNIRGWSLGFGLSF